MDTDMGKTTIGNIAGDTDLGIVTIGLVILFSLMAYYMVYSYIQEIKKHKNLDSGAELNNVVIELFGIPKGRDPVELEKQIFDTLSEHLQGVAAVVVIPDKTKALKCKRKMEEAKHLKESYEAEQNYRGKMPYIRTFCRCCQKTLNAIDFIEGKFSDRVLKFNVEVKKVEN